MPVKWVINGKELNECNRGVIVPKYGIKVMLQPGEQIVQFTPQETGVIPWSCWMGMIPGSFIVVETSPITQAAGEPPTPCVAGRLLARLGNSWQRLAQKSKGLWQRLESL